MSGQTSLAQRLAPVFVVCAAMVVYANALGNGFAYDDVHIIQQNTRVHELHAWRNIWLKPYWPFFGAEFGLYRPFIIFAYAVQWAIGNGAAWLFHAVNVLLHGGASLLVFLLLERLTARTPALIGALVFALHPVHTEAVANIVGQAELVAAVALFAACLIHVARPDGVALSWPRRLALTALFAVGLATKESVVVLPALLLALDLAQRRVRLERRSVRAYVDAMAMTVVLLAATAALYAMVRNDVLAGAFTGTDAAPALSFLRGDDRVLNALRVFPEYLRLLFFPQNLAADYSPGMILPVTSLTAMTLAGGLLLLALITLALATPLLPAAGLAAAWFLISIITVSNLFFPVGVLLAERTLYAPSFALSLAIATGWLHAAPRISPAVRRLAPALAGIVLLLLAARSWTRNPDWRSTQTVAASLMRDHPESYRVQWAEASRLWRSGLIEDAAQRFAFAHRIYAGDSQLLLEYGAFLLERGHTDSAVAMIEQAHALRPHLAATLLAHAYVRAARWTDALAIMPQAEAAGAHRTVTMPLRAHAYAALGQHAQAIAAWRVALTHSAVDSWVFRAFLARALASSGHADDAMAATAEARRAATDPRATRLLDRVDHAIRTGCYALPPLPARYPPCDPLGDYFRFSLEPENVANTAATPDTVRVAQTRVPNS